MSARRDIQKAAEQELDPYQVEFEFTTDTPPLFIEIYAPSGETKRIRYSLSPNGRNLEHFRGDLRRAVRALGAGKRPSKLRRQRQPDDEPPAAVTPEPISTEVKGEPSMTTLSLPGKSAAPPKDAAPSREYTKLHQHEVSTLTRLLMTNAVTDEEARMVIYHEGWSDQRLLEILQASPGRELLRVDHIINLRRECFGLLKSELPAPPESRNAAALLVIMGKKVEKLEARVQALEDAATAPTQSAV